MKGLAKVIPFRRPDPSASEKAIQARAQQILALLAESELAQFADNLLIARATWRKYPELVAAPGFPEHLRAPYMADFGRDPEDPGDCGEPFVSPETVRKLRMQAENLAPEEFARAGRQAAV